MSQSVAKAYSIVNPNSIHASSCSRNRTAHAHKAQSSAFGRADNSRRAAPLRDARAGVAPRVRRERNADARAASSSHSIQIVAAARDSFSAGRQVPLLRTRRLQSVSPPHALRSVATSAPSGNTHTRSVRSLRPPFRMPCSRASAIISSPAATNQAASPGRNRHTRAQRSAPQMDL